MLVLNLILRWPSCLQGKPLSKRQEAMMQRKAAQRTPNGKMVSLRFSRVMFERSRPHLRFCNQGLLHVHLIAESAMRLCNVSSKPHAWLDL